MQRSMKFTHDQFQVNQAWVLFKLDSLVFVGGQPIDIYVLMDAASEYIFGQLLVLEDVPDEMETQELFKKAFKIKKKWPQKLLLVKGDPAETLFVEQAEKRKIKVEIVPLSYLEPLIEPAKQSFEKFSKGHRADATSAPPAAKDREQARQLIPDSYDPCPCASGKKFKFCCKPIFPNIVEAMCAAEEGNFNEAMRSLDKAIEKAGETAEVLCRMAIVHSLKSEEKFIEYLEKTLEKSPNHPRAHYLYGLHHKEKNNLQAAAASYEAAIKNYPPTDKFHLNETWNNLGSVFYDLHEFDKAKGAWEKALMYLPSDPMAKKNLMEFIYSNPNIPEDLREPSPFVKTYL
jgi:TolA-binding protein